MPTEIRTRPAARTAEFGLLYAQVQQFYAHQLQLADAQDGERWAQTFTEDAVLVAPLPGRPVRGRSRLAARASGPAGRDTAGARTRRWIGMLEVHPQPDGTLSTRCSALAYRAGRLHVCAMQDVLVRSGNTWRIRHRLLTRDDDHTCP
ncbi:nuclear transport factor 2 family protein [Streptomyces sp. AM8-1-1]|nr:nuclear transport factor 2 family protein [Streptomyces sp. AM8-1-1]WNO76584.1 nuclear transport factor 2 family protein [Streptomyces sp. AM8-1-1]